MSRILELISDVFLGRYEVPATDTLSVPPDTDDVGVVHSRQETQEALERGTRLVAEADARPV